MSYESELSILNEEKDLIYLNPFSEINKENFL